MDKKLPFSEKYQKQLLTLGIKSIKDFIYYFPEKVQFIDYITYNPNIDSGFFRAEVLSEAKISYFNKKSLLRVAVQIDGYQVTLQCFNQPYLVSKLNKGVIFTCFGKKIKKGVLNAAQFNFNLQQSEKPIIKYRLLKGMRQQTFQKYVLQILEQKEMPNFLPKVIHQKYQLIARKAAFEQLHLPKDIELYRKAIQYFKYEEAFLFQLQLYIRKTLFTKNVYNKKDVYKEEDLANIIKGLPFDLTKGQKQVLKEIIQDFSRDKLMYRLVQGDVGSGKTVLAVLASYLKVMKGYQCAILAPTTILAEQLYLNFKKFLSGTGIKIAFLKSQMPLKKRQQLIVELQKGTIQILVGTHAILEEDIMFRNLGLAIIDEQQRFGVEQRKKLRNKGIIVDTMYMTATPIPRTLAVSVFGDLDISIIDTLPEGRKPITTKIILKKNWRRLLEEIQEVVARGEQVYIVCPLIEASEKLEGLSPIEELYCQFREDLAKNICIGILHGKLKNDEKMENLKKFSENEIQVLISTTVVEVGVHVERATLMIIYDATQFGLSQLHQLRGRVGRGNLPSTCILVADYQNERLEAMVMSQDGFYLAEQDLRLRGPGELLGVKQSGIPMFRFLNIQNDLKILKLAKKDMIDILEGELTNQEGEKIYAYIEKKKKELDDFLY